VEASQWCLKTYWVDGLRRRRYEAVEPQKQLWDAGVLIRADGLSPPREVQFFHDSMQSFLTAHGLAAQDGEGYAQLPPPPGDDPQGWDRGRVLLRAAADPVFTRARSDLLLKGAAELFQMCLATFVPREGLRRWLHGELENWAVVYEEYLSKDRIKAALPRSMRIRLKPDEKVADVLRRAADRCFTADEKADSVDRLGALYAGLARLVFGKKPRKVLRD
jgi:hypothetical protein